MDPCYVCSSVGFNKYAATVKKQSILTSPPQLRLVAVACSLWPWAAACLLGTVGSVAVLKVAYEWNHSALLFRVRLLPSQGASLHLSLQRCLPLSLSGLPLWEQHRLPLTCRRYLGCVPCLATVNEAFGNLVYKESLFGFMVAFL